MRISTLLYLATSIDSKSRLSGKSFFQPLSTIRSTHPKYSVAPSLIGYRCSHINLENKIAATEFDECPEFESCPMDSDFLKMLQSEFGISGVETSMLPKSTIEREYFSQAGYQSKDRKALDIPVSKHLDASEQDEYLAISKQVDDKRINFLAKRLAAKNALQSAYQQHFGEKVRLEDCIIGHDALGKPIADIRGKSEDCELLFSISDDIYAVSIAVPKIGLAGLGVDVTILSRYEEMTSIRREKFINNFFSPMERKEYDELLQSGSEKQVVTFLAKSWATKEAVVKALGTGFRSKNDFESNILPSEIAMSCDTQGRVKAEFFGDTKAWVMGKGLGDVIVGFGENQDFIVAYAFLLNT